MTDENNGRFSDERISVFEVNGSLFGVNILKSREVLPLPYLTPVPNTADFIVGIFNLRGDIFPLLDISTILGMQKKQIRDSDMVILLEGNNLVSGILVDRVHSVHNLNNTSVKSVHGLVPKKMETFLSGSFSDRSSSIYLLDIDRLFSSATVLTYY